MSIVWTGEKLRIRPSSVDSFFVCSYQWAQTYIAGNTSMSSVRAAMGTAIHFGVEEMWKEAIATKAKVPNLTMMKDAAVGEFVSIEQQEEMTFEYGEDMNTATYEITGGIDAFVEDIVPFKDIPVAVEQRYTIKLDHAMVDDISGTVDYISADSIDDVKTSKRKPIPANYKTQQSIYKLLAVANGVDVKYNNIQGVVLKKQPQGHILTLEPDVPQAKYLINTILDTLDVFQQDLVAPEVLFRPNTKNYLCSPKYCTFYGKTCPATGGCSTPKQHVVKL